MSIDVQDALEKLFLLALFAPKKSARKLGTSVNILKYFAGGKKYVLHN